MFKKQRCLRFVIGARLIQPSERPSRPASSWPPEPPTSRIPLDCFIAAQLSRSSSFSRASSFSDNSLSSADAASFSAFSVDTCSSTCLLRTLSRSTVSCSSASHLLAGVQLRFQLADPGLAPFQSIAHRSALGVFIPQPSLLGLQFVLSLSIWVRRASIARG